MSSDAVTTRADAQINRLLGSEDIANVRLGLHLAENASIEIQDYSVLVGLALLHPSRDINQSAADVLHVRIGNAYAKAIHGYWQETYVNGEAKHFYKALASVERELGLAKGRLQGIAVRLTGIFPDNVAHRFPLAFKEWCLTNLQPGGSLDFIGLQIPKLPPNILEVPGIKYLSLGRSKLEILPDFIDGLEELETLDCSGLRIQHLPGTLANLKQLHTVVINGGRLAELPKVLQGIAPLRTLRIINGHPNLMDNLAQIPQLTTLEIRANNIMPLPEDIAKLSLLTDLRVDGAALRELPNGVADLPNLESLVINSCKLRAIPASFSALGKLLELQIGLLQRRCNLPDLNGLDALDSLNVYFEERPPFSYPVNWCNLPELRQLLISGPVSSLPSEFQQLQNLRSLCFRKSGFRTFPQEVAGITTLRYLEIRDADFASEDFEIRPLTALEEVNFSNCGLKNVPKALFDMPSLEAINLSNNHIPVSQVNMLRDRFPLANIVMH